MSAADVRKIKRLAERLGVRDSDIIRFAVKSTLNKLGPLHDPTVRGRALVPVFLDCGQELFQQFDIDTVRLEHIFNDGAEPVSQVARDDVHLIAMNRGRQPYLRWPAATPATTAAKAGMVATHVPRDLNGRGYVVESDLAEEPEEVERSSVSVRSYLFKKYLYGDGGTR